MNTYTVDPLLDPRWERFLDRHPRASVFHTPGWLRALQRSCGYQPIVFTTTPPGQELANGLVFCKVDSWITGRRLVSLPFSDHCEPLVDANHELEFLVHSVLDYSQSAHHKYTEIRPFHAIQFNHNGGPCMATSKAFYLHTVDLRPSVSELYRSFHKSEQRKIRRAEREGLTIDEGRSPQLLHEFYRLFTQTRRRHRLPPQPSSWFKTLIDSLGERLTIRVAYKNGRPLASMLTISFKQSVVYKYGCSDGQFHNIGAVQLLFWLTIQKEKSRGAVELDLGRSEIGHDGLANFKDHWASVRSQMSYYRYPPLESSEARREWIAGAAGYAFSRLPDVLLIAVGRLLYPHVG